MNRLGQPARALAAQRHGGGIGAKIVDADNIVRFVEVQIVSDTATGVPARVTIAAVSTCPETSSSSKSSASASTIRTLAAIKSREQRVCCTCAVTGDALPIIAKLGDGHALPTWDEHRVVAESHVAPLAEADLADEGSLDA